MELIRRGEAITLDPEPAPVEAQIEMVVNTGGNGYEPTSGMSPRGTTGHSRKLPWGAGRAIAAHTSGTKYATTREAMRAEGLDWEVLKGPLASHHNGVTRPVEGWETVQRADTGKVLGVVKGRYEPIQNRRLAEFNDVLVKESGGETAAVGSAFDDKRVYCVTKLGDIDSPDGGLGSFLITANSHDGTTALWSTVANVRWSCANGLVGLSDLAHTVKIRHTIKAEERLGEAIRIMAGVSAYLEDTTRVMEELLRTPVPPTVVEQLIPVPTYDAQLDNRRAVRSAQKRQDELLATWRHSENLEGVRDTGWGFVNAVAEFNEWTGSHVQRRRRTPMERLLADTGQDMMREARDLVLAG